MVQGIVNLLNQGYNFFQTGEIGKRVSPSRFSEIDRRIVEKYETNISRWERSRRRNAGIATFRYLRLDGGRWWALLATPGRCAVFESEAFRSVHRNAIYCPEGYTVSKRKSPVDHRYRVSTAISREEYLRLKAQLISDAKRVRDAGCLEEEFRRAMQWNAYARIRRQYLNVLRAVNRERHASGLEALPYGVLPLAKRPVKVYADVLNFE